MMIVQIMNDCIKVIKKTYGVIGKRPIYVNAWSFRKIGKWMLAHNVPQEKIDALLDIYRTLRFE